MGGSLFRYKRLKSVEGSVIYRNLLNLVAIHKGFYGAFIYPVRPQPGVSYLATDSHLASVERLHCFNNQLLGQDKNE